MDTAHSPKKEGDRKIAFDVLPKSDLKIPMPKTTPPKSSGGDNSGSNKKK